MRMIVWMMTVALSGTLSAEVIQRVELQLVPSSNPASRHAIDVVTTIATDGQFPERLELIINPPPDFLGMPEPNLEGEMRVTTPAALEAAEDGALLTATHEPKTWSWLVQPGEAKAVRLRYRVLVTSEHLVPESTRAQNEVFFYFVGERHAMLGTMMTTATAANARPDRVLARVITPAGLELFSPWPIAKDVGRAGETWYEMPPRALLEDSDFLPLGRWVGPSLTSGEFKVSMLFPPEGVEFEQRLRKPLQQFMDYGLRLFGNSLKENLVFAFRLNESGNGSTSGTVVANSAYIVFDSRRAAVDPEPLLHVLAHEFVHLWGRRTVRIGGVEEMRWMHEGFTDYYASQICARLGLVPPESFARGFAERVERCRQSPLRGRWSIAAAGPRGMQGDEPSTELVYNGGWLLAAWLDAAIRREAIARGKKADFAPAAGDVAKLGTLDEFMRDFYNNPEWSEQLRPTPALFLQRLAKYLPPEKIAKFEQFITEPWAFDPVVEFSALGVPAELRRVPAERLGVILGAGKLVIQELQAGGAAEAFGLQPEDEILRVNGLSVQAAAELRSAWQQSGAGDTEVVVRRGGKEETLRGTKPLAERFEVEPALLLR
jgi:predicted metalloprotease with PDZ domain